jgi:hypothetical protein
MALTTIEENLARSAWNHWRADTKLTFIEVMQLAAHFTKTCRNADQDYKAYDFTSMLDSQLLYDENLTLIDQELKPTTNDTYAEALEQLENAPKLLQENTRLTAQVEKLKAKLAAQATTNQTQTALTPEPQKAPQEQKQENMDTTELELTDFVVEYLANSEDLETLPNGKKAYRWKLREFLLKHGRIEEARKLGKPI